MYRKSRNYENVQKLNCSVCGKYDIPFIYCDIDFSRCEFIGFNYAKSEKNPSKKGVHFFLDDYQFERVWNSPDKYVEILKKFKYVMSPDFSLFTDFPVALQIYNHYRKQFVGSYLQNQGCIVIPTVCWSDEKSYEWCFDGIQKNGVVCVSSVGTQKQNKSEFVDGYNEMMKRINPKTILFYGNIPKGIEGNIVKINAFTDKFRRE